MGIKTVEIIGECFIYTFNVNTQNDFRIEVQLARHFR